MIIGKQILNYKIERQIGEGGMGRVYLANNLHIDQQVAIKVLSPQLLKNEDVLRRFKQEANLLASLDHSNIVKFLNYYEDEEGFYLVMEYVPGKTMEDYINTESGPIPQEKALELFSPLLEAFDYAHKKNIVHRDIKPSNIIITPDHKLKVLDFGIARIIKETVPGATKVGTRMGTAMYMSPEQVQGGDIDHRSDIYALGVVLHQMISGEAPYDDTTMSEYEINMKVVEEKLPRTKELYPFASDEVQMVIDKAVEKRRDDRFQNCQEFKHSLTYAIHPEAEVEAAPPPPKNRKKLKIILGAAAVVILIASIWIWDYNRLKTAYYKDYVEIWGVPEGIHELSSSESSHAEAFLKFESRRGKVLRITRVNSEGLMQEYSNSEDVERPNDLIIHYRDDGKIDFSEVLDRNGKVLYIKDYNQKLNVVTFRHSDEFETEMSMTAVTTELFKDPFVDGGDKGEITRWLLEYDEDGYVVELKYAKTQNAAASDQDGIYGRKMKLDDKGRVIEVLYLNQDGEVKQTKLGFAGKRYKYDEEDNRTEASWIDKDGNLTRNSMGHSVEKDYFDEYGNVLKEEWYDVDGDPVINSRGFFQWRAKYDEHGNSVHYTTYDTKGNPCAGNDGTFGRKSVYDDMGNATQIIYLGESGEPAFGSGGYAISEWKFDEKGNIIEGWYKDPKGKLCFNSSGYAGFSYELDSLGNTTEYRVYGVNKQPCLQENGYNGYQAKYDSKGNLIQGTYIDTTGNPTSNDNNVVTWKHIYDNRGNITEIKYFDAKGEPTLNGSGISGYRYEYDEKGNETALILVGLDGEISAGDYDYAQLKYKHDEWGNTIETRYYDAEDKPVLYNDEYAGKKSKYDSRGNLIEEYKIDKEGELADGYLIRKSRYDDNDNEVERKYLDGKRKPAQNNAGYSSWTAQYDDRGNTLKKSFLGTDGKLIAGDEGFAYTTGQYNSRGKVITQKFFDKNDNASTNNSYQVPLVRYTYNKLGHLTSTSYFLLDGETATENKIGIHKNEWVNDRFGRTIEYTRYDKNGNLATGDDHKGRYKLKYDSRGNTIEKSYYDINDNLVLCGEKYATKKMTYDGKGNLTGVTFWGTGGGSAQSSNGYHQALYEYDKRGNHIRTSYTDTEGDLTKSTDKYAIVEKTYNEKGKLIETIYYDKNHKETNNGSGFSRIVSEYSPKGILLSEKCINTSKVTIIKRQYDEEGELLYSEVKDGAGNRVRIYSDGHTEIVTVENFYNNNKGWRYVTNHRTSSAELGSFIPVSGGKLKPSKSASGKEYIVISNNTTLPRNFTLECRFKFKRVYDKDKYFAGLTWSGPGANFPVFVIDKSNFFTAPTGWRSSNKVNRSGYNNLKVVSNGSTYKYYLNNQLLSTRRGVSKSNTNLIGFAYKDCLIEVDQLKLSSRR